MKWKLLGQTVVSGIIGEIPIYFFEKIIGPNLIIPYYHMVRDDKIPHVSNLYRYKKIKQFEDDMDWLLRNFSSISLNEILSMVKNECKIEREVFFLTFDDGFRELSDIVAPILLKKGVQATFFICSSFIDNKEMNYQHKTSLLIEKIKRGLSLPLKKRIEVFWKKTGLSNSDIEKNILPIGYLQKDLIDALAHIMEVDFNEYLSKYEPYLTTGQIKKLLKDGFHIGAHSLDHPGYQGIPLKEQLNQTLTSLKMIRNNFNLNYGAFAFPYSDFGISREYFRKIQQSGLVDVSFGTGGMINDTISNNLQRFSLEKPLMPASKIIAVQYAKKIARKIKGGDEIKRI